ncbi:unnamed protein product [Schistosoma turkestanicum]|nr:unnamed protein product [Schistosoma turkestanicum]
MNLNVYYEGNVLNKGSTTTLSHQRPLHFMKRAQFLPLVSVKTTNHLKMVATYQQSSLTIVLSFICLLVVGYVHARIDDQTRSLLLSLHNNARKLALQGLLEGQPIARSIKELKWNTYLEMKAQKLADKCNFEHDDDIERQVPGFDNVGQNLAGANRIDIGFNLWLNEYKNYDYFNRFCRAGRCSQYTQIVWENTTDVGCGVAKCPHSPFELSIVCNYGPGGGCPKYSPYHVRGHYSQRIMKYRNKCCVHKAVKKCGPKYVRQTCNGTMEVVLPEKKYTAIKRYICP